MVILASDADHDISSRAAEVLLNLPPESFIAAISRADADARLFAYCAQELTPHPGVADALAKNPACPRDLLPSVVPILSSSGVQAVLDDLEGLTNSADLPPALAGATQATLEQKQLIAELNQGAPSEKEAEEMVDAASAPAAGPAAAQAAPAIDPARRLTLIQRIAKMTVVDRIRHALTGDREVRMALIRDRNKIVQRAVLQSPRLTDTEVEAFAAMANVNDEVLRAISLNRRFMKSYIVAKNLLNNPKTPIDASLHLLPRLTSTDLKLLTTNKNIPDTLRTMAIKLQRQRNLDRKTS